MKNSVVAILIALLFTLPTLVFAQRSGMPPEGRRDMRERVKEELKLTDQQLVQIHKLRLDMQRKQSQIRSKIDLSRFDIQESFLAEKPDRSTIEKATKQIADLQSQSKLARLDFWFAVNSILTADQQKIWKRHLGDMRHGRRPPMARRMIMRGHGMGMGMPMAPEPDGEPK